MLTPSTSPEATLEKIEHPTLKVNDSDTLLYPIP
jgi:hypothetical protein